jgi:hypothetical protein
VEGIAETAMTTTDRERTWRSTKTRQSTARSSRPHSVGSWKCPRWWWKFYDELPPVTTWAQSWDMAFKDTASSDFVVGFVGARQGADIYLVNRVKGQWAFSETLIPRWTLRATNVGNVGIVTHPTWATLRTLKRRIELDPVLARVRLLLDQPASTMTVRQPRTASLVDASWC